MEKEISFEEKLEKLKTIVGGLESGEIPLKESIDKFKEGAELIKQCYKELEEAELKVEMAVKEDAGERDEE
ncbi:exodeoxyribonuclease VII small subunit [Candidatus Pacearchaeota archaeon RBG_13_36_9]|nr:MAG: exodeoxyribonuclease VII small subunit [Candidatus Pacearchaeota archaeon RBG_13_36_9]